MSRNTAKPPKDLTPPPPGGMTTAMMDCSETCLTTLFMLAGILLATWAVWSENRWRKKHEIPIVPTTPVMFIGVLAALLALVHLMTLAGVKKP